MTSWLRVAAWWSLIAAAGWACVVTLVDRLAGAGVLVTTAPALASGGVATLARAELASRSGDAALADRLAREALTRRPVDAAVLRVAASLAPGARAEALMRLAGAAGWRDRETQLYWAEAALEQGAYATAAERLEALLRLGSSEEARSLLRRVEATPAGRAALMQRWTGEDWLVNPVADWPRDGEAALANRYATVRAMQPRLRRDDRNRLAAGLLVAGRVNWAFDLVRPDERRLAFVTGDVREPLGWNLSAAAGLEAVAEGGALHVRASGSALLPLGEHVLRLPVGSTQLALLTKGTQADLPVLVTLVCHKRSGADAEPTSVARGRAVYRLTVPAGCPAQTVQLAVAGEEARRGTDFWLMPPTLSPASAAP